jgi:hypothetical protein
MSKTIATMALACALAAGTAIPAAQADRNRGHDRDRGHHAYNDRDRDHHRGRGHWRNGRWIALGVAAEAAAAIANDRDCYYRYGRRYCR